MTKGRFCWSALPFEEVFDFFSRFTRIGRHLLCAPRRLSSYRLNTVLWHWENSLAIPHQSFLYLTGINNITLCDLEFQIKEEVRRQEGSCRWHLGGLRYRPHPEGAVGTRSCHVSGSPWQGLFKISFWFHLVTKGSMGCGDVRKSLEQKGHKWGLRGLSGETLEGHRGNYFL